MVGELWTALGIVLIGECRPKKFPSAHTRAWCANFPPLFTTAGPSLWPELGPLSHFQPFCHMERCVLWCRMHVPMGPAIDINNLPSIDHAQLTSKQCLCRGNPCSEETANMKQDQSKVVPSGHHRPALKGTPRYNFVIVKMFACPFTRPSINRRHEFGRLLLGGLC